MSGTVRSTDGEPIPGALLDIWQADEDGFYDVQYEDLDEARGRGHLHSADDGRYWFWTVQPEAYPIPTDGPVGSMLAATSRSPMRPAHVHFKVTAPGYQTLSPTSSTSATSTSTPTRSSACAARCWRPSSTTIPAPRPTGAR